MHLSIACPGGTTPEATGGETTVIRGFETYFAPGTRRIDKIRHASKYQGNGEGDFFIYKRYCGLNFRKSRPLRLRVCIS